MGKVKIPYYVVRGSEKPGSKRWGYWAPCLARPNKQTGIFEPTLMAELGFKHVNCGEDGPLAWAKAQMWNERWKESRRRHRAGEKSSPRERAYPPGSIGEGFQKLRRTAEWSSAKKKRTREDWERGWKHIEPIFADVDANTVSMEDISAWYRGDPNNPRIKGLLGTISTREAYRAMKIWRALWKALEGMKRTDGERYATVKDPSLSVRRKTPEKRTALWLFDEAVRLFARAGQEGFLGLQAALATAWDTMLSPVDVRRLTRAMRGQDALGGLFDLARAKSGQAAVGTLTASTEALIDAYIKGLPFTLHPGTPIFHTKGSAPGPKGGRPRPPAPYTKDTLGRDFRIIRKLEFPGDTRTVADFRRSGAIEVVAGQGSRETLARKMANTIDSNAQLEATYLPNVTSVVRLADEARSRGREVLRSGVKRNGSGT